MRGELRYARSKRFSRLAWLLFWTALFGLLAYGFYLIVGNIQMRSLPAGQIQLTVPYSRYLVGETVTFTIKNNYNSAIYLTNDCPAEPLYVYRQENGAWVRIHDTASINECPTEARQIEVAANGSVNGSFAPWHNLFNIPGKYRIVAYVEYYDALPYQDFEVVAKYIPAPKPTSAPVISNPVLPVYTQPATQTISPTTTTTTTYSEPNDD